MHGIALVPVTHNTGVAGVSGPRRANLAEAAFPGHLGRAKGTDSLALTSEWIEGVMVQRVRLSVRHFFWGVGEPA